MKYLDEQDAVEAAHNAKVQELFGALVESRRAGVPDAVGKFVLGLRLLRDARESAVKAIECEEKL